MNQITKIIRVIRKKLSSCKGQTLVEYGLLLALIAVVLIAIVTILGTTLDLKYSNIVQSLPQ